MTPDFVATLRAAGVVFAEDEAALLLEAATDPADLAARIARRCDGEPLEQVVGWALFDGLRIPVTPGVFVPRRRSEALVETADRLLAPGSVGERVVVLDLCCGTGALGVALARRLRARGVVTDLVVSDVDPAAARCARATLDAGGTTGAVVCGDLFDAVPGRLRGCVDVLLANVPYVPAAEVARLPREARDHEPRTALDGGSDGLSLLRRMAPGAGEWLAPGGLLLTEATSRQALAAAHALAGPGRTVHVVDDEERDVSVVVATSGDR